MTELKGASAQMQFMYRRLSSEHQKAILQVIEALLFYDDFNKCSCCEDEKSTVVFCKTCYDDILYAKQYKITEDILTMIWQETFYDQVENKKYIEPQELIKLIRKKYRVNDEKERL